MQSISLTRFPLLIGTAILSIPLNAQQSDLLIEEIKHGVAIERVNPKYPIAAARTGQEGWVIVSYVIGKDGKVNSAIVEDSSNAKMFNKATLRAVNQWVYEPTTVNGKAIEQCKNSVRMDFNLSNGDKGARRKFVGRYKDILSMIEEKDYENAADAIAKLKKKGAWNLYEDAWLSSLEVEYYHKIGDLNGEINALNHLRSAGREYLDTNTTLNHLVRLFQINLSKKLYVDTLSVAKKIKKIDTKELVYPKLLKTVKQVETFVANGGNYLVEGVIDNGVWHYDLARQSFAFQGSTDNLRKLDIRCENKHLTYQVKDQSIWTIPKSYGPCSIYVYGDDKTPVQLVEVSEPT